MINFNNSLVVVFLVLIARESRVKFLVKATLFANGLKTVGSKNAHCPLCQEPRATTSKWASSEELALLIKTSPVKGWRCGSTSASWHTSLRRDVNRSCTLSCLLWTNPAFIHDIAWSTSNLLPQGHVDGRHFSVQWCLRLSPLSNSLLFRSKFSDFNGNVVIQN